MTYDQDNSGNCAVDYKTAWWLAGCFEANLNGPYQHQASTVYAMGLIWRHKVTYDESLQFSEMKVCR